MNPSEQHNQEDLERRLRDAFAAKALQISDADLDREREDEVAAAFSSRRRSSTATRIFAGIGAAAAAAAIVVVTVVGLHGGKHEVVNGLPPATTASSSSAAHSIATSPQVPTGSSKTPALNQPATPGDRNNSSLSSSGPGSSGSSAPTSGTKTTARAGSSTLPGSSTSMTGSSSKLSAAGHQPPAMSPGLPQSGRLSNQEYSGPVPLRDPSGGEPRMLSMPSDLTWQRTAEDASSLTVRITYLPTDIEAYWRDKLPGEGWVQNGSGWSYPGTSYTVSPISDKGSFTVTW